VRKKGKIIINNIPLFLLLLKADILDQHAVEIRVLFDFKKAN